MFYERYVSLCTREKFSPSTAAVKAGFNKGTVSVWKKKYEAGQDVVPEQEIVDKICAFFGCSESWLRGIEKAPTPEGERGIDEQNLKVAFFRGADPTLTKEDMDAMWEDARAFRDFIVAKRKREKEKNGG